MKAREVHNKELHRLTTYVKTAMIKNVDAAIIINREIDDTSDPEKQYLGFKLEKYRGKPNKDKLYVFLHPFDENNGISLTSDLDSKPLSRLRMEDFNPIGNTQIISNGKPVFTDYDDTNNDFINSLKDIIDDDYTDSAKNYVDMYKNAENISNKMKRLNQMEKDIRDRYSKELKSIDIKRNEKGYIILHKAKTTIENIILDKTDSRYIIKSRNR